MVQPSAFVHRASELRERRALAKRRVRPVLVVMLHAGTNYARDYILAASNKIASAGSR
jgi:hypothetical protein